MKKSTKTFLIVAGIASVVTVATIAVAKTIKKLKNDLGDCVFNDDIDFTGCDSCLSCGRDEDEEEPKKEYDFSNATTSTYTIFNHYATKDEVAEMINEAMEKAKEEKVD